MHLLALVFISQFADKWFTTMAAKILALLGLAIVLANCDASTPLVERIELGQEPPQKMYEFAEELRITEKDVPLRAERNGERLINKYDWSGYVHDLIERFYPDSPYAALGQLRQGEAYFDEGDYDKAVPELEEFIREHPGHPLLDRAYYISAMCAFVQISTEGLDPGDTRISIARFRRLLREKPDSQFAPEARQRILAAQTQLAATEIRLGVTLQRQKNFEGAISRHLRVVEDFETTPYIEEALFRLVESYLSLGIRQEAERYAKILGKNYPNSEWYAMAYGLMTGNPVQPPVADFFGSLFGG